MKAYLLAFFALFLLSSFCPPKKKYKQKVDGLWVRVVMDEIDSRVTNNVNVETHSAVWTIYEFESKSNKGYVKYCQYTTVKVDTILNEFGDEVTAEFTYDIRKDDIGNLLTLKIDSVYIEGVDSAAYPQLYKYPKQHAAYLENNTFKFYYKIAPDSNRYNIKSFQFINPSKGTLDVFHHVGEKYNRW